MGKLLSGSPTGDWKGKIGNVVLSSWNSTCIIKSAPVRKNSTKQSEKQSIQNATFRMVMFFLSEVTRTIKIGYQKPRKPKMTPLNKATSYHLLNAIVDDPEQIRIDLAKVKFSMPIRSTQRAWNVVLACEEGRNVTVKWELNPFPLKCTQLNDHVIFVFYDRDTGGFREVLPGHVDRDGLSFSYIVPQNCVGHDWFCYMLMASADGKLVSETDYLGMVTIKP